jgi:methionine sulfoxide reductase catalytic subunit
MPYLKFSERWEIPEREATPEHIYCSRRHFIKELGFAGLSVLALSKLRLSRAAAAPEFESLASGPSEPTATPVPQNSKYVLDRPITAEEEATHYTNFYEFTTSKREVADLVERFETRPWELEVTGLVDKPGIFDIDDLLRAAPLEERLYRFRCVERWAMAVPWVGFPMKSLLSMVEPKSSARYVKLVTFFRPDQAPGQSDPGWPWPYTEGLTMDEALNELTLVATGVYGKEMPKQNGSPLRLIVPWKYGLKSIKSIVQIELTEEKPPTFWETVAPNEYPFESNVDPDVAHPRWSQSEEIMLGTQEKRPTLKYNGYGEYVAHLYES